MLPALPHCVNSDAGRGALSQFQKSAVEEKRSVFEAPKLSRISSRVSETMDRIEDTVDGRWAYLGMADVSSHVLRSTLSELIRYLKDGRVQPVCSSHDFSLMVFSG